MNKNEEPCTVVHPAYNMFCIKTGYHRRHQIEIETGHPSSPGKDVVTWRNEK